MEWLSFPGPTDLADASRILPQKGSLWSDEKWEMRGSMDIFKLPSTQNFFEEPVLFEQINVTIIRMITNKINIQIKVQRKYKGEEIVRKYLALDF